MGESWHGEVLDLLHIVHGGAEAVKLGYGECWAVESASEPDTFHLCARLKGGAWVCSCKGFRYRNECRHVTLMKAEVAKRPDLFYDWSS